jgi:hypothetical protein
VVKRVSVLALVNAAHGDNAARIAEVSASCYEGVRKIIEKIGFGGWGEGFFLLGRHFARVDGVQDFLPPLCGKVIGQCQGEIIDTELSLLFISVMASSAVRFECGSMFFRKVRGWFG